MPRLAYHLVRPLISLAALLLVVHIGGRLEASAQVARVLTLADSLDGAVGGIAVDRAGNIYSADFQDSVWRIRPDGRVQLFASGLYGPSGNYFDRFGNLMQANFYGHYISRIDRKGEHEIWVDEGLNGPVGVTITAAGEMYVCNCSGNTISRVNDQRVAEEFSAGSLYRCPNGITSTPDGRLFVVNFSDGALIEIDSEGVASLFATIPGGGNGHVTFARGSLYVTSLQGHSVYRVGLDGTIELVAGNGRPGEVDGSPDEAMFTFPNGIAVAPAGDRMFVNDFVNRFPPTLDIPPAAVSSVRLIKLANLAERMAAALSTGGIPALEAVHTAFRADPATAGGFTQIQLNTLGYQLMQAGSMDAAIRVFELNVADYPQAYNPHDSLGEAYFNAGRLDEAAAAYTKALELNPDSESARAMLARIQGGG